MAKSVIDDIMKECPKRIQFWTDRLTDEQMAEYKLIREAFLNGKLADRSPSGLARFIKQRFQLTDVATDTIRKSLKG